MDLATTDVTIRNRTAKRGRGWYLEAGTEASGVTKDTDGIWVVFPVHSNGGDDHTVSFWLRDILKSRSSFSVDAHSGALRELLASVGIEGGLVYAPEYRIDIVGEGEGKVNLALSLKQWLETTVSPVTFQVGISEASFVDVRRYAAVILDTATYSDTIEATILPAPVTVFVSDRPLRSIGKAHRIVAFQSEDVARLPVSEPMSVAMLPPNEFLVFDRGNDGNRIGRGRIVDHGVGRDPALVGIDLAQLITPALRGNE
jgi:hypothetical protein